MGDSVANYNDTLPALNAALNAMSAVCLSLGYLFIKKKRPIAHRNVMIAAFSVSTLFLVSYLYYHFNFTARRFEGDGVIRGLYLAMLITHILGAIVLVPGVISLLYRAYQFNWVKHKQLARWVWPLWMYTSITGVLIYFSLYGARSA